MRHTQAVVRAGGPRPWTAALTVTAVGAVVTAVLAWAAWRAHDDNEDRLLAERTREAAAVLAASIGGVEVPMELAAAVAEDPAVAQRVLEAQTGVAPFASASVWPTDGTEPDVVVGMEPLLATRPAEEIRALFERAQATDGMSVSFVGEGDERRLAYAYTVGTGPASVAVYAEQPVPAGTTTRSPEGEAFDGLDFALYLGDEADGDDLLFSSTPELPLRGRSHAETTPFGDTGLLLVMSPTHDLGGGLLAALPWIGLGVGTAMTAFVTVLVHRLQRRRRDAERLAAENARLYAEQRAASLTLQHSFLPRALPDVDGVDIAVRYVAGVEGTEVGGDWYDVIPVDDHLVVVIGDVSGRGLVAASVMASVRHSIRAFAAQGDDPATILDKVGALDRTERQGHFATVLCGTVHPRTRAVTFANAGHPPPLVVDADGARYADTVVGPPIGIANGSGYGSSRTDVAPSATMFLVTDGLFERRGETLDVGLERLRTTAASTNGSLDATVDSLLHRMTGDAPSDDAAILALRWWA